MNCFLHDTPSIGVCMVCGKAMCRECVGVDAPKLICRPCLERKGVLGYEYVSKAKWGNWPMVHICAGINPQTGRPKVAKGVIAMGNISVGLISFGGIALGAVSFGGISLGGLLALGGVAVGLGLSLGGLAVGSIAVGGLAIGFKLAIGGAAIGPAIIDGQTCSPAAKEMLLEFVNREVLPPPCR